MNSIRRCAFLLMLLLATACSGETANSAATASPGSEQIESTQSEANTAGETKLLEQARQIVENYALTEISLTCLKFELLEQRFEGKYMVDVREKHGGDCRGDPATAPRLFSIGIDPATGAVWSDAKSLLGQLEKLGAE